MGFKLWIGRAIDNTINKIIERNYRMASFLPNGRILELDLKRAGFMPRCIFDVGANEGQTAQNYIKHFLQATIYCFEPVKDVYQTLVAKTNHPQIKCFNLALGDVAGEAKIYKSKSANDIGTLNGSYTGFLTESETIKVDVGDDICREHQINTIDLLKIDVEGYELPVLRGFERMLPKTKFIYIEAGLTPSDPCKTHISDLIGHLQQYNFIVSGFYSQYRIGKDKLKLSHCDVLFTNTALVDAG